MKVQRCTFIVQGIANVRLFVQAIRWLEKARALTIRVIQLHSETSESFPPEFLLSLPDVFEGRWSQIRELESFQKGKYEGPY